MDLLSICGHCGKRREEHYFEREIYCYDNTTGDTWSEEPSDEMIAEMIQEAHPELWDAMVIKWKTENGHLP